MNVTQKKIEANRENAKKSTGPVTDEGKAKVSMNSVKHGRYLTQFNRITGELAGNLPICDPCGDEQKAKCKANSTCLMWDHMALQYIKSHAMKDPTYIEQISIPQIATMDLIFQQNLRYAQQNMFKVEKRTNLVSGVEYDVPIIGIDFLKMLFDMAERLSKTIKDMQLTRATQENIDVEWAKLAMEKLDPDKAIENKEKILEDMDRFRETYSDAIKKKQMDEAILEFRNKDGIIEDNTNTDKFDDLGSSPFGNG